MLPAREPVHHIAHQAWVRPGQKPERIGHWRRRACGGPKKSTNALNGDIQTQVAPSPIGGHCQSGLLLRQSKTGPISQR